MEKIRLLNCPGIVCPGSSSELDAIDLQLAVFPGDGRTHCFLRLVEGGQELGCAAGEELAWGFHKSGK
jgi:hypothetical protein